MNINITIELLAEKLNGKLWQKENLKRIYIDAGYNTKKMSTKTYVYEKDGEFKVSVYIDCPSQPYEWIKSQQDKIIEGVNESINDIIDRVEKPDKYEHENYMPYSKRVKHELAPVVAPSPAPVSQTIVSAPIPSCTDFTGEKYKHNIFGIGNKIAEDEGTITLDFNGVQKHLLKKFAKLEKID